MASHYNQDRHSRPTVSITRSINVQSKSVQSPYYNKILSLSNLDRQCPALMYSVFFYKPTSSNLQNASFRGKSSSVFERLKAGLEETLSLWYPAGGRLMMNPSNGNKLDLWCNNGGAVLVEAETRVKMSELGDDLSQYSEFLENLVYKPRLDLATISHMPLVTAQVTKFSCGGYVVGVGTSHALFDGPAAFNFLSAWATAANTFSHHGAASKLLQCQRPVHERGRLLQNARGGHFGNCRVAAIDHLYQMMTQAATELGGLKANPLLLQGQSSALVLRTFHLSGSMIESLKRKVAGPWGGSDPSSCSTFEILAAHLWKARTKAQGVKKDKMVCLQFAVDTRSRVAPPLSLGFSGNAYVLASIALSAAQLESETLSSLVERVTAAKRAVNDDYVSLYIESLGATVQQKGGLPPLGELTIVSDLTRMPLHKINFIDGEPAACAFPLASVMPEVSYFLQSPGDCKGIDLRIGLPSQALNAFSYYFLQGL